MLQQERTFYANIMYQIVQYTKFCNMLSLLTYILCLLYALYNHMYYPYGQMTNYFLVTIAALGLIQIGALFQIKEYAFYYAYALRHGRDMYVDD